MLERPFLLMPVKSLRCGKSRLETTLSPAERRRLNEFFLRHMIAVAAQYPGLGRTAVVSDADDSLTLAAELGARAIHTARRDLNGALADGCRELRRGGVQRILILPVDLPLVEAHDLRVLAAAGERHAVTISPDRDGVGTNALMVADDLPLRFTFGDDSYRLHQAEARRCGVTPLLHLDPRIAQDVDRPADLALLDERAAAGA
jgi:2-phospho-L-lactate guanylyltransferase